MWPILFASIVALTVVIERLWFIVSESFRRQPQIVGEILARVEKGDVDGAVSIGQTSRDFVARILTYGLAHRDKSASEALLRASNWELKRYNRGLTIVDTLVTTELRGTIEIGRGSAPLPRPGTRIEVRVPTGGPADW